MKRILLAAALVLAGTASFARNYPDHPVRMIVPFPPGGGFIGSREVEAAGAAREDHAGLSEFPRLHERPQGGKPR